MFGGAVESNWTRRNALAYADRISGRAACEEYCDGGEDADAEVGLFGERACGPTNEESSIASLK